MPASSRDRFSGIEAVLFDYGGTLDSNGVPWKERFQALLAAEGHDLPPPVFDPAFYTADDALVGGVPKDFSYEDTVMRLAENLVAGLGLDLPDLAARLGRRFLDESLRQVAANAAVLDALSRRYRLGIVSNFYGNLERVCRDAGIAGYMAVMVDSTRVGCTKPDAAIFDAALIGLGTEAAKTVFVGDSLRRDRTGAEGM
ncbi:MAG: HAD family hydrolase, partial [Alphaproteobacteria bacterium]|nr:HAD family hydrolase [Alphaproteobacteria bacterium]